MAREMKDSGVEWIGEIPAEWKINTLSQLFLQVKNKNTNLQETNLLSLSYGRIKRKNIDISTGLLPESFDSYNVIEKNDIVFRLTDLQNDHTSLRVGISEERGIITSAYLTIRKKDRVCPQYFFYYFYSFDIAKGFYGMGAGVRQGLNWDGVKSLKVLVPSIKEQEKIALYLSKKCTEIDALLEKIRTSIEEYKKLKQAIITQAVTKGVRGDRPMKDSGIEWVGEIPEDWRISRIKYVSKFSPNYNCDSLTPDSMVTYTPMEYIKDGYYIQNTVPYSSLATSLTVYAEGDIVIAKVTPCFENGNISIMNNLSSKFGFGSSELFVLAPKEIVTEYLFYWLQNTLFIERACSTMTGTGGLKRVSPYFIKNCEIHLPRTNEQIEIVTHLSRSCQKIDANIQNKKKLIQHIESYKKSLIYEYVTGKKEVPKI